VEIKEALEHAITKSRKNSGQHHPVSIAEVQKVLVTPGISYYKEKFLVSYRHQLIPVNTTDIACFRKDVLIYANTFNGEEYILDHDSLEELESLLNPAQFFRTNRQYIININAVHHVNPYSTGKMSVVLLSGLQRQIDVSREKATSFRKWLGG
jgi:DNA-binding LytR/AlgR family response regulator